MRKTATLVLFSFAILAILAGAAVAQHEHHQATTPAPSQNGMAQQDEMNQVTDVMARHSHDDHDHHMGPHMKMSALRSAHDLSGLACFAKAQPPSPYPDATMPAQSDGFYYFVRARNSCGPGPLGNQSNGTPRPTPACP